MLHEIKNVRQECGSGGRRRWFESDGLDLVVWLDRGNGVSGFQLCYNLGRGERALTWRVDAGFAHSSIDTGDDSPLANRTPVLEPDPDVPWGAIARLFNARSATLEPQLRQLVHDTLTKRTASDAAR